MTRSRRAFSRLAVSFAALCAASALAAAPVRVSFGVEGLAPSLGASAAAAPGALMSPSAPAFAPSFAPALAPTVLAPVPAASLAAPSAEPGADRPAAAPAAAPATTPPAAPAAAGRAGASDGTAKIQVDANPSRYDGRFFDGAKTAAGAEATVGGVGGASRPSGLAPAPKRRLPLGNFARAAAVGAALAAAIPAGWSAVSTPAALIYFAAAALPIAAFGVLLAAWRLGALAVRLVRKTPRPEAPTRVGRRVARLTGLLVGAALTVGVMANQATLTERTWRAVEARTPASELQVRTPLDSMFTLRVVSDLQGVPGGEEAVARARAADAHGRLPRFVIVERRATTTAVRGDFFARQTAAVLARTAEGRAVLDGLRDRGGVLRMPHFYVSHQTGTAAVTEAPEAIYLSAQVIEDHGVTVERFLSDEKLQAEFIEREQALLLHELRHADQARGNPFSPDRIAFLKVNGARLKAMVFGRGADSTSVEAETPAPDPAFADVGPTMLGDRTIELSGADIRAASGESVRGFADDRAAQDAFVATHLAELQREMSAVEPAPPAPAPTPNIAIPLERPSPAAAAAPKPPHAGFGVVQEWEYEAYISGLNYTHERLQQDPGRPMSDEELRDYRRGLLPFDEFEKTIDGYEIYSSNFHATSPRLERVLADARAGWDARRVESHLLLARRAAALGDASAARDEYAAAKKLAAEKGLPAPAIPSSKPSHH